ncbi:Arogenate dehydratase/prephenate dehydratase 2, chloroplastic [Hordeum vulgare]|nr:Arogenate dehydratase/prephenate dehydratase 2, chloroplastic [Hordeum vulgare]
MTASSSSSLRIPAPTHHPAAGALPLRLPFHSVSVRPRRSLVSASTSPQQAPGPGDGDRANGRTGVPVPAPFSRDAAIALPRPLTSADLMGEASGEGLKVAYQGCPGAYGEAAAKKAYPSCETVPCEYFETAFQLWFGLEAWRVHAMALETKQVGLCIKKVLRSAPGFFAFLLSSSPVIICTTLLLGILLSYGDTNLPEANDEDTKTTPEIPSLKVDNSSRDVQFGSHQRISVPSFRNTTKNFKGRETKRTGMVRKLDGGRGRLAEAVDAVRDHGAGALHLAVAAGKQLEVCEYLVEDVGVNVDAVDEAGHCEIVELLLSRGAYVNPFSAHHGTPLHVAAQHKQEWAMKILLDHHADMQNPNCKVMVDNCYGEFVETSEPPMVVADLIAGSLIKNPGGTIAPCGGYVAGKKDLVAATAARLSAPGLGVEFGLAPGHVMRAMFQGLFLAPQMVGEAVKGGLLIAEVMSAKGYRVQPLPRAPRHDIVQNRVATSALNGRRAIISVVDLTTDSSEKGLKGARWHGNHSAAKVIVNNDLFS